MNAKLPPERLRWLLVLGFSFFAFVVGALGYLLYKKQEGDLRTDEARQLSAIADLKRAELINWRRERESDALVVYGDRAIARRFKEFLDNRSSPSLERELVGWMESWRRNYNYGSIFFLDQKGAIRLSAPPRVTRISPDTRDLAMEAVLARNVIFSDLHKDEITHETCLDLLVPLLVPQARDTICTGIILLRIDPYKFLYPFIQSWPTPSLTGETLLLRREGNDVVYLNELRHRKNTALSLRLPLTDEHLPAAMGARGRRGIVEGFDYRGVPVLASIKEVPNSSWYLVAKVDQEELYASIWTHLRFIGGIVGLIILAGGIATAFVWRSRSAHLYRELYESERQRGALVEHYSYLTKYANDIVLLATADGRIVEANDRAVAAYGYERDELLQLSLKDLRAPETVALLERDLKEVQERNGKMFETLHRRKDGSVFPVEVSSRVITIEESGFYQHVIRDITERKRTEEHISRLNRLYAVLGQINQTIVRTRDRNTLFEEICRVAVEIGKFRMAWVGLVDADQKVVRPVASRGVVDGYLTDIRIVAADEPQGRGPTGTAIREGKIIICNDAASDARMKPWRKRMLQRGYRSSAAVPIHLEGRVIGAFNVYADEVDFFDRGEIRLLGEIAGDITYALGAIEQEEKRTRAEEELQKSEARLKEAQVAGRIGCWSYDVESRKIVWSDETYRLYGRDPALGPPTPEEEAAYYSPQQADILREYARRAIEEGKPFEYDLEANVQGGRHVYLSATMQPIRGHDGRVVELFGTVQDISERKRAEEALRESGKRYQTLAEISPVGIFRTDSEGRTTYVNRRWCEITGLASSEALGYGWLSAVHPEDRQSIESGWKEATQAHGGSKTEYRFKRPDGTVTWVIGQAIPEKNEKGEVVAHIGTLTDITERRRVEEALKASEERLRLLFEYAPDAYYLSDLKGNFVDGNRAAEQLTGYRREELIGENFFKLKLLPVSEMSRAAALLARNALRQPTGPDEFTLARQDGAKVFAEIRAFPVEIGGRVLVLGIARDVTERKKAEQRASALAELIHRLSSASDREAAAGVIVQTADELIGWDACTFDLYSRETDAVHPVLTIDVIDGRRAHVPPSYIDRKPTQRMRSVLERGAQLILRKQGEEMPPDAIPFGDTTRASSSLMIVPIRHGAEVIGILSIQSYTRDRYSEDDLQFLQGLADHCGAALERIRAHGELAEKEQRFRTLIETMSEGLIQVSREEVVQFVNRRFCEIVGYSADELTGKPAYGVFLHPKDAAVVREKDQLRLQGVTDSYELQVRKKSGEVIWALVSGAPIYGPYGAVTGTVGIFTDITERKRSEEALRLFRALIDRSNDAFEVLDPATGRFLDMSEKAWVDLGYSREELLSLTIFDIDSTIDRSKYANLGELLRGAGFATAEGRHRRKDGSSFPVELNLRYVQLDRGYVVIVARDITERKRAAEALRESEEKLRLIVENAFDGISIFEETPDPDQRRLIECNARYAEMAGRSREELLSIGNTRDLARPLSQDNTPSIQRGVAFRGTFTWLRPDEKDNIVEYTAVPIKMKGKTYTIGIDRDVTERKKAEENIQRALEWQEAIFEGSRDAVFISDNESRFVAVNKAACELTGYPKEELLKMRIPDLHEETDLEAYRRFHDRIMGGEEILSEAKILRKDGSKVDTEFSNTLIFIAGIPYEHTAARDITERKRAEEALSKERSLLRALMDNVPDHIYFKDADSRFITMSRAQADRFGLSDPSQVLGKTDFDFFTEEHARPAFEDEQKIIQTGQPIVGVEEKETWPDGRVTWVSTTKMPLRDKEGNIIGTFGISRDITERKRAEKALRDEKALMDALMDNIPDSIYFKDRQCRLVRINRKMMKDLKLEEVSQAVGKTDIELFGEEFGRKTMISDQHLIATGEPIVGLLESRQLEDGRINWTLTTKVPLRDEGGHITGLVGITSEINEFMRVQEALRENEQRLKVALTCADIAVFNQDKHLRYTWMFNPQLGFLPQEAIGKTDKDLFSRADVSMLTKIKQKVLETGVGAHEEVLMTLDHQEIVVLLNIEPLRDLSGAIIGLTGAMNDITQRKLAELEIRRNREWLQAILDASRDGILAEKDGTIAYANASFARIYGYDDPAELIGKHATVGLAPEESRRLMDFGRRRLLGESMPNAYEFKGIRKDGKAVELEASVSTARIAGDTHIITTVRDISERKLLQKQVVEAQKMESIGTLAGGIAHDFNNILGIIMGHSSILEQMRSDPDKFLRSVQAINKATFRGAGLVRQLLTFARKTEVTMQSVLINDTLSELAKLLGETLPKTIVMELNLEKKLPSILADPTQLHQVFLNLCVNARDAMMPKGGRLSITTRLASGEAVSTKFSRADATEYIVVNVADSGAGMDEATCSRIFEPFFTTKGKGKGTGLGLATVYGIIESHRGFIDVESTVGVGSTFHVYFPVEPRHVRPQEVEKAAEKDIPGGTETILVVEDEETLRNLICLVLEGKGYRVLQASDGEEGLQQFTEHQHEIALVLSDLGLPKMSGEDLLNTIRELKPEAKIILASGYAEPGIKSELLKSGAKEIIQKPYDPVEVLKKIREVLDTGR